MAAEPMPIEPTDQELDYRAKNYKDLKDIISKQITCATCGVNLITKVDKPGSVFVHPLVTTLQCKKCSDFYGDGDFSMDEDAEDKYCRMCGNGGELYLCGNKPCPYGFCQKCVDRYVGKNSAEVKADDWKCLYCNCKPLWAVRAVCAIIVLEKSRKRIKHTKRWTRTEVYDSDSTSEDSKLTARRPFQRSLRKNKEASKLLKSIKKICDSNNDSSDPSHESFIHRKNSVARIKQRPSGSHFISMLMGSSSDSSVQKRRLHAKVLSSEDEISDSSETEIVPKSRINSKFENSFAKVVSKSIKTRNTRSISRLGEINQNDPSQTRTRLLKSPQSWKSSSQFDSESSHESANDFVKSKKKKNLSTQKKKSNQMDSTVQMTKSNKLASINSNEDVRQLRPKSDKSVTERKIREPSVELQSTNHRNEHSIRGSSTITTKNKTRKSERNSEDSKEKNKDSYTRTKLVRNSTPCASKKTCQRIDSETEGDESYGNPKICAKVSISTDHRRSQQEPPTKRLSKLSQLLQRSYSHDHDTGYSDERKAFIKHSYAKYISTVDDCVTDDETLIIKNHLCTLINKIKIFGKGLYDNTINEVATKQVLNNLTNVASISKIVLKFLLLLIRCRENLDAIEREFIDSYENWCKNSKVKSIFAGVANIDIATDGEVKSNVSEKTSSETKKKDGISGDIKASSAPDNSTQCSDSSECDANRNIDNQLIRNVVKSTSETANTCSDNEDNNLDDLESREEFSKNIKEAMNRHSDIESRDSVRQVISDCDSRGIFSEDEDEQRSSQVQERTAQRISTKSPSLNTLEKQSIESNSNECEDIHVQDSREIGKKSVECDNAIESLIDPPKKRGDVITKKFIDNKTEKSTEQESTDDSCVVNTHRLDATTDDLLDNATSSDLENAQNLTRESRHSISNDECLTDCSVMTVKLDVPTKSYNTEVKNSHLSDVQTTSDNETDGSSKNNRNPTVESKQNSKLKTSAHDSTANDNVIVEDFSDCDTEIIFSQTLTDDLTNDSNTTTRMAKNNENMANLGKTEDSNVPNSQVKNDGKVRLENDINCNDDTVRQSKKSFDALETIANESEEVPDSGIHENTEDVPKSSKPRRESHKSGNIIKNVSNVPSQYTEGSETDDSKVKNKQATVVDDNTKESKTDNSKVKKKQATVADDNTEEIARKKLLESDSESSDSNMILDLDSFTLKMETDSEETAMRSVSTNSTLNISDISKQSHRVETDTQKFKKNTPDRPSADTSIFELNDLSRQRLLLSSECSNSDTEDMSPAKSTNVNDISDSHSTSSKEDSTNRLNSVAKNRFKSSKLKRKKFDLKNNECYQKDEKLRLPCEVVVRRLDETVLDQFRQFLSKSKERQELEDFKSLIDLNNLKKRKRGTIESNQSESSCESTSSKAHAKKKKSKQMQEKEETLMDHLERMQNGESYFNPDNESDDENDTLNKLLPDDETGEEFLTRVNEFAKDLLIQSSDSENETRTLIGNAEEEDQGENSKLEMQAEKQKKKVKNAPEKAADSGSSHESESNTGNDNEETKNDEENSDSKDNEGSDSSETRRKKKLIAGLAKRNWRLTDSDSSSEEKKWNKSQEKKHEDKSTVEKEEDGSKKKKKVKRRLVRSDSDSVALEDLSDNSVEMLDENKNSSSDSEDSSEIFKNLRKKKRRKPNSGQKSDAESESEEDEKPSKLKRKRIKKMASDSDSENDGLTNSQDTPGKLHRKNIRKVLKDKQVADVTKIAGKEEEERLKRIADRQKLYNEMYELKLAREAKVDKLVLDFDEETKKELVSVHEDLVKRLKPHQAQGIKFMWDACFESLARTKTTKGSGCIVAHCMGLGKTFQVVTLAHTLLTHPETGIKTIMVICPLSTVLNWVNEFKKWLGDINNDEDVEVFEMTKMKKNFERKYQLEKWKRAGGVMVLGYEMFRLLSNQTGKKMRKSLHESILKCLVDPGPDLIVCDEGHLLKNEDTALSKAMRRVKTLRRIVLTGTPLQNNLVEYHCMVQFVKPNLLGTKKEFLNRFVNPITNGQFDDSTEYDVKLMKKRAHVLHKMLEGSVQRFDYSVLTPFLPPKQEYVITVRLADIQIKLYQHYLDNFSRKKVGAGTSLFADFQALQRIWTHPIVLRMNAEKTERLNEKRRMDTSDSEGSLKDFLDDGSDEKTTTSEDSDVQSAHSSSEEKTDKRKRGTRANPIDPDTEVLEEEEQPQSGEWWSQFVEPEHFEDMKISSKLVILFAILKECEQIGDKVLVFSQSLYALSLIEEFLDKIDDETQRGSCSELIDGHSGSWSLGLDYFRLDGQTAPENRSHYCKIFNNPKNSRARLFLISTRAGGLGINLTAANRVIIFDASWNPSHDVQSIFRIYRFGQKKPCYVYRFLAQGTMEEKIYNRQVTKLSLSCRVVDEQQIERHYSNHDLAELYQFEPNTSKEKPTLNLPKDRLLAEIFRKYEDRIETFHEHDSLLENKAEEELDEEERKEAWKEYEDERTGRKMYTNNFSMQNFGMQPYDMMNINQADVVNRAVLSGINIDTLQALIRKDYPNTTPEQQTMMTQRAIMDMYAYMENEAVRQQQMAAAAAASSFTYPTVSNIGTGSFVDGTGMTPAQRQYALQQQQRHQMLVQREQQANYAKRFGNVRGPALAATTTRPPQIVNVSLDDNEVIEVPTTPPLTAGPTPSSSVQTPGASTPATAENSKRQEE